jgi:hypothetical protein
MPEFRSMACSGGLEPPQKASIPCSLTADRTLSAIFQSLPVTSGIETDLTSIGLEMTIPGRKRRPRSTGAESQVAADMETSITAVFVLYSSLRYYL